MRFLVVRAGALGDTLMATPVVRAITERHPDATVDVLSSKAAAPLLELHPGVDRVMALRWRNLPYAVSIEKRRLVTALRDRAYDIAVLLERAAKYRDLVERAGVREIRSFRESPFDPKSHASANNLHAAGLDGSTDMDLYLSADDERRASVLLEGLERPVVGLHTGYGPRGKKRDQSARLKGWPLTHFIELGKKLTDLGVSLVLTGSAEDQGDVARLAAALPALDLSGRTTVRELGAVIQKLDVFVSVDSGPAHMAAAVATPLVVLWGPAILEQVRPVSSTSPVAVVREPVPCAPCYETPLMKTCRRNICMEYITPDRVLEVTRALLSQNGAREKES